MLSIGLPVTQKQHKFAWGQFAIHLYTAHLYHIILFCVCLYQHWSKVRKTQKTKLMTFLLVFKFLLKVFIKLLWRTSRFSSVREVKKMLATHKVKVQVNLFVFDKINRTNSLRWWKNFCVILFIQCFLSLVPILYLLNSCPWFTFNLYQHLCNHVVFFGGLVFLIGELCNL